MRKINILLLWLFAFCPILAQADIAYLALADDGYWQAWVMDDNGKKNKQITHSAFDKTRLSWYPGGNALFINGSNGALYQVNIKNKKENKIKMKLHGMFDAVISPDGKTFTFSLSTSGSVDDNNIWLADAKGHNLRKITHMKKMQHEPSWSLDGKFIYFLSGDGGQAHDIWRINIASKSTKQLTVSQLYHFDIAPGPRKWLAFSSNRSGNYELWIARKKKTKKVTEHPALDARPSWSHNGKSLVFESARNGVLNIWEKHLKTKELKQLTKHKKGARFPVVCCYGEKR